MSDFLNDWDASVELFFGDDVISYYAFFITILAEISYLWVYMTDIAKPLTFILLGFIANVLVIAFVKGHLIWGRKANIITSVVYVLVFLGLFIWETSFTSVKISAILTIIPFAVAFLWMKIRGFQNTSFGPGFPKIVYVLSKVFGQGLTGRLSQVIIIGGPIIVFTVLFSKIPMIPIALKIIVPIVYFCVVTPYIAFIEDDWATENIFELATEWDFF